MTPEAAADRVRRAPHRGHGRRPAHPHVPARTDGLTDPSPEEAARWREPLHAPTGEDLSVLHLHDRHTELGLSRRRPRRHVPHDPPGPRARPEDLGPQPDGQGRLRRRRPGPRGRAGRLGLGAASRATTSSCPYYRDTGVMLTLGHDRRGDPAGGLRPRRRPELRRPADAEPLGLRATATSSPARRRSPPSSPTPPGSPTRPSSAARTRVAVSYFGEGATSKGDFHEALNFAGIHQLPDGVRLREQRLRHLGAADQGVGGRRRRRPRPQLRLRRGDRRRQRPARRVRRRRTPPSAGPARGEGPTLVECKTYRYLAHTSDDDDRTYRTPQEVEAWRKKDPLRRIKQYLIEQRLLSEADEDAHRGRGEGRGRRGRQAGRGAAAPEPADGLHEGLRPAAAPASGACPRAPATSRSPAAAEPAPAGPTTERNIVDTVRQTQQRAPGRRRAGAVVLGEDVGPRGGVFRATDGLAAEFGARPRARHAAGRVVDHRHRRSALALAGLRPDRRDPVRRLHPLRLRPAGVARRPASTTGRNGDFAVPLVVRAPWGGGVHGALYHSQSIEATLRPHPRASRWWSRRRRPTWPGCSARRSTTPTRCCSSSTRRPTG